MEAHPSRGQEQVEQPRDLTVMGTLPSLSLMRKPGVRLRESRRRATVALTCVLGPPLLTHSPSGRVESMRKIMKCTQRSYNNINIAIEVIVITYTYGMGIGFEASSTPNIANEAVLELSADGEEVVGR